VVLGYRPSLKPRSGLSSDEDQKGMERRGRRISRDGITRRQIGYGRRVLGKEAEEERVKKRGGKRDRGLT